MIIDLVKANRSYRGYDESRAVTEEELKVLCEMARLTASSVNVQPLKYYLAWEKEEVARIQKLTGWAKALPDTKLPRDGKCPTAFIVICQDTNVNDLLHKYLKDVGIVAQTMLLGAVEMGLGGCMIGNYSPERVKAELPLSDNLVPLLIVAVGKPDETVVMVDVEEGDSMKYYRDENDVHYVPKRKLEDLIIAKTK